MAIVAVSGAHIAADLATGGTSGTFVSTGSDLLVMAVGFFSGDPVISDSKGNTWTQIANYDFFGIAHIWLLYALNAIVGSGHTVTSGTNRSAIAVGGFSGSDLTAPYDTPNQNGQMTGSGSATVQPGSITPSVNNCLVVSGLYFESGTLSSIGSGFTVFDTQQPGNSGVSLAYKIQTTAGAENPLWTASTGNTRIGAEIASFKAAAAVAFAISHMTPGQQTEIGTCI